MAARIAYGACSGSGAHGTERTGTRLESAPFRPRVSPYTPRESLHSLFFYIAIPIELSLTSTRQYFRPLPLFIYKAGVQSAYCGLCGTTRLREHARRFLSTRDFGHFGRVITNDYNSAVRSPPGPRTCVHYSTYYRLLTHTQRLLFKARWPLQTSAQAQSQNGPIWALADTLENPNKWSPCDPTCDLCLPKGTRAGRYTPTAGIQC